jgi:hypothetical protein
MGDWASVLPLVIVLALVFWVVHLVRAGRRSVVPPAVHGAGLAGALPVASAPDAAACVLSAGAVFERVCWVVTMLAAVAGAYRLFDLAQARGASAPQYAAEAAGVCAAVIVPYVFSRAVASFRRA